MKLATIRYHGEICVGIVDAEAKTVAPIPGCVDMHALFGCMDIIPGDQALPLSEVELLAPIPHPAQDVICLGINYSEHAKESEHYSREAFGGERRLWRDVTSKK